MLLFIVLDVVEMFESSLRRSLVPPTLVLLLLSGSVIASLDPLSEDPL